MTKYYYIEVRLGSKWVLVETKTRQVDALDYVRTQSVDHKYPLRVVKVTRTIVFQGA
jgi:hypothetical protein